VEVLELYLVWFFFALKTVGVPNVKLYPKSFKEWKSLGKPKTEFKDATYWDLSAE
jgi:thiosulfate/3-mercaptopyruvate sulfurtransferase